MSIDSCANCLYRADCTDYDERYDICANYAREEDMESKGE